MKTSKPKLFKKSIDPSINIITDITRAFDILFQKESLYHITITGIPVNHVKQLNHILTNNFFNTIHKDYRKTFEFINYLFIIEYGGAISKPSISIIDDLGIHAHLVLNTSLSKRQLEFYINTCFIKIPDYRIDDISGSDNKNGLMNYLLKQDLYSKLLTEDNYNYKIKI